MSYPQGSPSQDRVDLALALPPMTEHDLRPNTLAAQGIPHQLAVNSQQLHMLGTYPIYINNTSHPYLSPQQLAQSQFPELYWTQMQYGQTSPKSQQQSAWQPGQVFTVPGARHTPIPQQSAHSGSVHPDVRRIQMPNREQASSAARQTPSLRQTPASRAEIEQLLARRGCALDKSSGKWLKYLGIKNGKQQWAAVGRLANGRFIGVLVGGRPLPIVGPFDEFGVLLEAVSGPGQAMNGNVPVALLQGTPVSQAIPPAQLSATMSTSISQDPMRHQRATTRPTSHPMSASAASPTNKKRMASGELKNCPPPAQQRIRPTASPVLTSSLVPVSVSASAPQPRPRPQPQGVSPRALKQRFVLKALRRHSREDQRLIWGCAKAVSTGSRKGPFEYLWDRFLDPAMTAVERGMDRDGWLPTWNPDGTPCSPIQNGANADTNADAAKVELYDPDALPRVSTPPPIDFDAFDQAIDGLSPLSELGTLVGGMLDEIWSKRAGM